MSSRREQIVQAVVSALAGAGKPSGTSLYRTPVVQFGDEDIPRISVVQVSDALESGSGVMGPVQVRRLTLDVIVNANSNLSGVTCDQVGDDCMAWVHKALAPSLTTGSSLGGLAVKIEDGGIEFEFDRGAVAQMTARMRFEIHYQVRVDDATLGS